MHLLIAGGTGFIGQYLTNCYIQRNDQVSIIGRSSSKINQLYNKQVTAISWDDFKANGKAIIQEVDLIINLSGAGIADKKWTPQQKEEIIKSRVEATQNLVNHCLQLKNPNLTLFNASAVGIYGTQPIPNHQIPTGLTESVPVHSAKAPGFAAQVVRAWEEAAYPAEQAGMRVIFLRFGTVLGQGGGALQRLLPLFRLGLGGKMGSGKQPFPWTSLPEIKHVIDFLIKHKEISGPVNVVSPHYTTQAEFAHSLGKFLGRPTFLTTPAWLIELAFGQLGDELLLEGQHVVPQVLLNHHYSFQHPTLKEALPQIL